MLYRKNKLYKIELSNRMYYTGIVAAEDNSSIVIKTTRGEEIVISKEQIVRATLESTIPKND